MYQSIRFVELDPQNVEGGEVTNCHMKESCQCFCIYMYSILCDHFLIVQNTFEGVFIPCVASVLGTILFLRVPWIVAHAGIGGALGLLLLSFLVVCHNFHGFLFADSNFFLWVLFLSILS